MSDLSAFLFYSFHLNISLCVFLSLALVVAVSLFILLVSFPIQVLYFCLGSFRANQFYNRLVLLFINYLFIANGLGDLSSIPGHVIPKILKMVLDTSLRNTQQYEVYIKGKVEQSRERVVPSPTPWCSSYWKGSPLVALDKRLQTLLTVLSSVIFPARIFINNFFTLLVSTLTFYQSGFLKDGNIVFTSLMIFFIKSTFFLSSYVNVDVVVLGSMVFWFSVFCASIKVGGSCLYSKQLLCTYISSFSRSENQPFIKIIPVWSTSFWLVVLNLANLYHSFTVISLYKIALRLTVKNIFAVFSNSFLSLVSLRWIITLVFVHVPRFNPGKEVVPFPTPQCSSYWKGSLLVTLDYSHQLTLTGCQSDPLC